MTRKVILFGECLNLLRATPLKNGCTSLTLSHIKTLSDVSAADDFWKHYEKRRNCFCTVLIWGGGTVCFYEKYEVLPSSFTLMWYQHTIQYRRSNKTLFDLIWLKNNFTSRKNECLSYFNIDNAISLNPHCRAHTKFIFRLNGTSFNHFPHIYHCGRQWCIGSASASRIKGPWFESRDERVLTLGFFHTNGASTG